MTAIATKERPILFSGPMVRAILDGRKTVTRRIVKGRLEFAGGKDENQNDPSLWDTEWSYEDDGDPIPLSSLRCPFGAPGDRLWVRETFFLAGHLEGPVVHKKVGEELVVYRASNPDFMFTDDGGFHETNDAGEEVTHWKPSIFMPRWASRLTLEVVSVRVERLQEISLEDIAAEGVVKLDATAHYIRSSMSDADRDANTRHLFSLGWDSINGKRGSWAANPWVWRIEFRRLA